MMGMLFIVGAVVVAVVGIMLIAISEPYENSKSEYFEEGDR